MKKTLIVFALLVMANACGAQQASKETINMYFFWGQGCSHCEEMKPFIQELQNTYPQLSVKSLETFKNAENNRFFKEMVKAYNKSSDGVPGTFIGDRMFEGYSKGTTDKDITSVIESCIKNGCPDPDQKLAEYLKEHPATTTTTLQEPKPPEADPMVTAFAAILAVAMLALIYANRKQLM